MNEQSLINAAFWQRGNEVAAYANRNLSPAEVMILVRYRDAFAGRILELGCGAGRLTGYILALGGDVLGTDISQAMVEYCRRTYPGGSFRVLDLRDLTSLDDRYDVVVAGNNLLDVLDDQARRSALAEIRRLLEDGRLAVLSSHNRAFASQVPSPLTAVRGAGKLHALARLTRVPRWISNRRRLRPHERQEDGYAIVNDEAHDFGLLHYYIDRDAQARQLAEAGLVLVECIDRDGAAVGPGEHAAGSSELYYVARAGD